MKRSVADIAAGAVLLLVGAIVWKAGEVVPPSFLDEGFGSGYLPQMVGAAIMVLSALLLLQGLLTVRNPTDDVAPAARTKWWSRDWRPIAQLLLLLLLLAGLELRISFYPAAFLFMLASIYLLGAMSMRRFVAAAVVAGCATGSIWFLFNKVFLVII